MLAIIILLVLWLTEPVSFKLYMLTLALENTWDFSAVCKNHMLKFREGVEGAQETQTPDWMKGL